MTGVVFCVGRGSKDASCHVNIGIVARTLEGMAWIHISLAKHNDWPWQSAWKIVGPKA
jgi:hypothetical protein